MRCPAQVLSGSGEACAAGEGQEETTTTVAPWPPKASLQRHSTSTRARHPEFSGQVAIIAKRHQLQATAATEAAAATATATTAAGLLPHQALTKHETGLVT